MVETRDSNAASLDELFEMLGHEYRRRILVAVGRDNPRREDEITSKLIADGAGADGGALELLRQRIYHLHLPKLDEAGFVDWNRESGVVKRGPRFAEIEPLLELMSNHQDELPADWP